jgi:hypothetical protein
MEGRRGMRRGAAAARGAWAVCAVCVQRGKQRQVSAAAIADMGGTAIDQAPLAQLGRVPLIVCLLCLHGSLSRPGEAAEPSALAAQAVQLLTAGREDDAVQLIGALALGPPPPASAGGSGGGGSGGAGASRSSADAGCEPAVERLSSATTILERWLALRRAEGAEGDAARRRSGGGRRRGGRRRRSNNARRQVVSPPPSPFDLAVALVSTALLREVEDTPGAAVGGGGCDLVAR